MKRALAATAVAVLVLLFAVDAFAAWTATTAAGSTGGSAAAAMPMGTRPMATASADGASVAVAWTAPTSPVPIAGYRLYAYALGSGAERAVGGTCAGIVAALSCTDPAPEGS